MKARTPVRALVSRIVREADEDDPAAYAMAENALIDYEAGDSSGVPKILLFAIYEKLAMEAWRSERSGSAQAIERIRQKIESGSADKIAGIFDRLIDIAIYAGAEALNLRSVVTSRSSHWYDQLKKAVGRETDDLVVARKAANLVFQMAAEAKSAPVAENQPSIFDGRV